MVFVFCLTELMSMYVWCMKNFKFSSIFLQKAKEINYEFVLVLGFPAISSGISVSDKSCKYL